MSDLVGNPEDRFSHNEANIKTRDFMLQTTKVILVFVVCIFEEPRSEKTGLRGF